MERAEIQELVLGAITTINVGREQGHKLTVSPTAPLFGGASPLDSLGLVALLIDIEDALAGRGVSVALSDERALSERRSPFRSVPTLVDYIEKILAGQVA